MTTTQPNQTTQTRTRASAARVSQHVDPLSLLSYNRVTSRDGTRLAEPFLITDVLDPTRTLMSLSADVMAAVAPKSINPILDKRNAAVRAAVPKLGIYGQRLSGSNGRVHRTVFVSHEATQNPAPFITTAPGKFSLLESANASSEAANAARATLLAMGHTPNPLAVPAELLAGQTSGFGGLGLVRKSDRKTTCAMTGLTVTHHRFQTTGDGKVVAMLIDTEGGLFGDSASALFPVDPCRMQRMFTEGRHAPSLFEHGLSLSDAHYDLGRSVENVIDTLAYLLSSSQQVADPRTLFHQVLGLRPYVQGSQTDITDEQVMAARHFVRRELNSATTLHEYAGRVMQTSIGNGALNHAAVQYAMLEPGTQRPLQEYGGNRVADKLYGMEKLLRNGQH